MCRGPVQDLHSDGFRTWKQNCLRAHVLSCRFLTLLLHCLGPRLSGEFVPRSHDPLAKPSCRKQVTEMLTTIALTPGIRSRVRPFANPQTTWRGKRRSCVKREIACIEWRAHFLPETVGGVPTILQWWISGNKCNKTFPKSIAGFEQKQHGKWFAR